MNSPRSVRSSFFLHLHPERVRQRSLAPQTTLGLGLIGIVLLAVLTLTGVALMFWYVPLPGAAYDHLVDLRAGANPVGGLIRDVHRLASDALIVVMVLHLLRVYLTGALGRQRRLNWLVGLGLMLLITATAFTGFLLPWDADAYWAATVGGELAAIFPLIGGATRELLWGADHVGESTVLRAYALHVAALPFLGTLLMGYHIWRIRKAGGLARPHNASDTENQWIRTRPDLTMRELVITIGVVAALLAVALFWDAPLGLPGHPPRTLDPAKAPWFLLWIQELVSYAAWFGATVLTLLFLLLVAAPWFERDPENAGRWFAPGRRLRCAVFLGLYAIVLLLLVIANFYRGPGWRLVG